MRRVLLLTLLLLMIISVAAAQPVVRMAYTLVTPAYTREGLYTGEWVDDQPQGYGIFTTTNETGIQGHYIGYWQDGLMHGEGGTYREDDSCEVGRYDHGSFVDGYVIDAGSSQRTAAATTPDPTGEEPPFIGNRSSKKFHTPGCDSVRQMKAKNKVVFSSRDEAVALGYEPCSRCDP